MRRKSVHSCLCATAIAFLLGFGSTACMVTGLRLPAELVDLAMGCAIAALIPAVCLYFRRGELILSGIALLFTLLIGFSAEFQDQLLALCYSAMSYYHSAYGLVIPAQIDGCTAYSQLLPLLFIAGLIMVATVWIVVRRKPAFPAVILASVPLASCLVVTDTVPEAMPIFLLLFGMILLIITQSIRRQSERQGNKITLILAVPVIVVVSALLVFIPQEYYSAPEQISSVQDLLGWVSERLPVLEQTSDGRFVISFAGDERDQVDLTRVGNRVETNTAVMEIYTEYTGVLYLRGRDYDVYTGFDWKSSENRQEEGYGPSRRWQTIAEKAEIRVLGKRGQYYLPCYPTEQQTLYGGRIPNPNNETTYTYSFFPLRWDWKSSWVAMDQGIMVTVEVPSADARYLSLPEDTQKNAQNILDDIDFSGSRNTLDTANTIIRYVQNSAEYNLNPGRMPGSETDFAIWFLNDSDTGYCVHFASAATVLLRAAGIPARYVTGYTIATDPGQTTTVREKHAHAWVECYLDYIGWVIMDPTPSEVITPPDATESTTAPTTPSVTQPTVTQPTETTPTTAPTSTQSTNGTGDTTSGTPAPKPERELPQWFQTALTVIAWIAAAAVVIIGQWYLRRWLIQTQRHRGSPNRQAIVRYREIAHMSRACHVPIPDNLQNLAQKARFSQHMLTEDELGQIDRFRQECVKLLQKQRWYCRLVYRFIFVFY